MNDEWSSTRLSEVLKPVSRRTSVHPTEEYRLLGIRLDGGDAFHRETKLGSQISATTLFRVKTGDFIYSRLFAWRGAFGVINPHFDGFYVSGEFPTFTPIADKIDITYLQLWFRLPKIIEIVEADCTGSTPLTRNRFKENFFLALEIPLPPIEEQRRIVAHIEELATRIEEAQGLRQDIVNETELLIKATMRHIFQSIRHFQDKSLENVCSEIIDNLHSNPVYAEDGIPCVRSPDVGWGKLFLDKARKTNEEEYTRRIVRGEPKMDDIVLVREGGGTGKAAIVEDGQTFSLGQRVMMLRPNKNIVIPKFFLYQMLSPLIYDQILASWKGSASPHLNISTLRKFKLLIPPITEQIRIVSYLDDLQTKVDAMKQLQSETKAELDTLLPSILEKAFKGELV